MIVLGVDPGAAATGYGVVDRQAGGAVSLLECGVIRTDSSSTLANRLKDIHQASIKELEAGLAPELVEELERLSLPFTEDGTPSEGELRIEDDDCSFTFAQR